VTIKIIGVGFGRTGTASTQKALDMLGLPCYHMFEVIRNPQNRSHLKFWQGVANSVPGTQHRWEQVFSKYAATVDNPGCCVWRELMVAYPDAKVLLTLHPRGADAWFDSTTETIYRFQTMWQSRLLRLATPSGWRLSDMVGKLVWQRMLAGTMPNRRLAIGRYQQHIAEVKAAVPPERLLIYSVDQGWRPLCDFLGLPVPDVAFPNVNDRTEFRQMLDKMARAAYGVLTVGALLAAGAIYGLIRSAR
jgi:Sulfotransferase domain